MPNQTAKHAKKQRCAWCTSDALYIKYHDTEWGVPSHDDRHLFEMLCLEGAQAGLSWITVLKKRARYKEVFYDFDAKKIVRYVPGKVETLLADPGIIRNRLKVESVVKNARAFLDVQHELGSFHEYIWSFVDGAPIVNTWKTTKDIPAKTAISDAMSKAMKKRGFSFVGSTICYAYMQACGLVNDHTTDCFRYCT